MQVTCSSAKKLDSITCQKYKQIPAMDPQHLNEYWKTVVDSIQDGVMIVDPDGTARPTGPSREISGIFPQGNIWESLALLLNCSSCQIARAEKSCHWCAMFRKGKPEQAALHPDPQGLRGTVTILKNASVIKDNDGIVTGAVETMTDITDLVSQENPDSKTSAASWARKTAFTG